MPARLHVRALEQTMSRRVVHFLEQLVDSAFEEVKRRPDEIVEIEAQLRRSRARRRRSRCDRIAISIRVHAVVARSDFAFLHLLLFVFFVSMFAL